MEGGPHVPPGDSTQDYAQAIVESFNNPLDTTPPGNAAGRPQKRRDSLLVGRDGKRRKSNDIAGSSHSSSVASGVHQFQRSGEESQMPSYSGHLTEIARGTAILDDYGGRQNVQPRSPSQLDEVKHKIFISHSGAQKNFAEQLCVDLEKRGFVCPFFDQRQHSLPMGKDFVPLIKKAARNCHVGVVVLSKEYLLSKWPMIELAEFHGAQQAGNPRLNILPLFYQLSVKDLDEEAIANRWMPEWQKLADEDARIDVTKWSGAVRALRKVNGGVFGKKGRSEVDYREIIVKRIFQLSPPDFNYGSPQNMVGYSRLCEMARDRFVRGTSGGPSYLFLYGPIGVGKTTLSKALCDLFRGEYLNRVCYVDLDKRQRMGEDWDATSTTLGRIKLILARLCGFEKEPLDVIIDVEEGLTELRVHMKGEPVFLVLDSVMIENNSWSEAREYLRVRFHSESRIVIISRSQVNFRDLAPDIRFCMLMPSLIATEAGELFLRSAAPSKSLPLLTVEEERIVGLCIEQCTFDDMNEGRARLLSRSLSLMRYHPMALRALGDFFWRYFGDDHMLRWKDYLKENKDALWDLWKSTEGIGKIIRLQFHSLSSSEKLLFLDIAVFLNNVWRPPHGCYVTLLSKVHGNTEPVMQRRLQDFESSGMITLEREMGFWTFTMHDIYRRFAEWYVTNHKSKELKSARCVFKSRGSTLSDLVRLQMADASLASARVSASKRMQELCNLEVLLLDSCPELRELNLEGLVSLRFLKIRHLQNLGSVTLSRSHGTAESDGILDALQYVVLEDLESLVHGPDVRMCTSLQEYNVWNCPRMTNMNEMECPHLKELVLRGLVAHQLAGLPNIKTLRSIEFICITSNCVVDFSDVEASRIAQIARDIKKPYMRVLEEVVMSLNTNRMFNCGVVEDRMRSGEIRWVKSERIDDDKFLEFAFGGMIIEQIYGRTFDGSTKKKCIVRLKKKERWASP